MESVLNQHGGPWEMVLLKPFVLRVEIKIGNERNKYKKRDIKWEGLDLGAGLIQKRE